MVNARQRRHNQPGKKKTAKRTPRAPAITREMRVADIASLLPEALMLLAEYGLHCVGCSANGLESLEEGCRLHGFEDGEITELLVDLNALLRRQPARPATIATTDAAARALLHVMEEEGRTGEGLAVMADGRGGFCLEFRAAPVLGERTFIHDTEKQVRVFASALLLKRIGGATIDHREGRFKLDLAEDATCKGDGSCGGTCTCTHAEDAPAP